jgi:hypothetical protein
MPFSPLSKLSFHHTEDAGARIGTRRSSGPFNYILISESSGWLELWAFGCALSGINLGKSSQQWLIILIERSQIQLVLQIDILVWD